MGKTCVIFASRPVSKALLDTLPDEIGLILAVDAGYQTAVSLGLRPDFLLGDFDSAPPPPDPVCPVIRHPAHKDDTDTMLAVRKGLSEGCDCFYIYGALGGRMDHTIASIQTLSFLSAQGAQGVLLDETTRIFLLSGSCKLPRMEGWKLSVFAYGGKAAGVTEQGVAYPLQNALLTPDFPLGVSNEITAKMAEISVSSGRLLIMLVREP